MNEKELYERVGKALAIRRNELKLTQDQIAKKVGLSRASLANIETGRQKILLHYLYRIAAALEVDRIEELLPTGIHVAPPPTTDELSIEGDALNEKQRADVQAFLAQMNPKRRSSRGK